MDISLHRLACLLAFVVSANVALAAPEMRVSGRVDTDGDFTQESSMFDIESGEPFSRPIISVSDQSPGVWEYLARVDSTIPKLQIFGSILNDSGTSQSNVEAGLLNVSASQRDTVILSPTIIEPYIVTIDMVVDGLLDFDGGNARAGALLNVIPEGKLSTFDSRNYTTSQTIVGDTLTARYQLVGEATIDIQTQLFFSVQELDAGATAVGDFSNSAVIGLTITGLGGEPLSPADVVVSSGSGNFGTAVVPLPAALPLMLCALSGLLFGHAGRRKFRCAPGVRPA